MRRIAMNYGNTEVLINNLRAIVSNLETEKSQIRNALSELFDLENHYYEKNEIVQELEYRQVQVRNDIENIEDLMNNINRFKQSVREVDESLAHKFKQDIKKYAKQNNIKIASGIEKFLNNLQTGLDIVGLVPGIGDIGDAINGVIHLARGDIGNALISFVSVIPFVGDAAKGLKYMNKASDLLKLGDKVVDIGKATAKTAVSKSIKNVKKEAIGLLNKGENAVKGLLEATMNIGKGDYVLFLKKKPDIKVNLVKDNINPKGQAIAMVGCLIGDTLVVTDKGYKQIREISVGELVLSKNEEYGIIEYKKVIQIHKNSTYESCIIKTKNSIIEATTGHLFMVKDKWWTAAIDIKEKDFIEISSNEYEEIVEVEFKNRDYPISTYNLTVEDNHTYYSGVDKVLTHNMVGKNSCFKVGSNTESIPKRPSWRQSELDVQSDFPEYNPQKSFIDGKEVSYGTKGSSRPDFYKEGDSIEVKNYKITTPEGRSRLINNISNQVNKRITDLPDGTSQAIIIDVRGQNASNDVLRSIRDKILEKSNINVNIQFKR